MYKVKLKEVRELNETKQNEISKLLDVSLSAYSMYESEYNIIPIKHLNTIANYFGVSLDYFFGFSDIKFYDNLRINIDSKLSALRLKELRKDNKISQEELANILNSAPTTISDYERGARIIATPFLYQICKKYKISADYLLGKVDEQKYLK